MFSVLPKVGKFQYKNSTEEQEFSLVQMLNRRTLAPLLAMPVYIPFLNRHFPK